MVDLQTNTKMIMESAQTDFISVINSLLLLVDYKTEMLAQVRSADRSSIIDAAVASAKAAAILNVPVILTCADRNGEFVREIKEVFPGKDIIIRNGSSDAMSDETVRRMIRKYSREKLIIAGLWTSDSFTETALSAIREDYDVYGLIDACGDTSAERHNYGVHRMLKAGLTPITWMSLASEWMNGWAEPAESETDYMSGSKYNVMLTYLSRH